MKIDELQSNIGKRVKMNGYGDLAINSELRKFIFDDEDMYYLTIDRITKGGKAIIRHGKHLYSIPPNNVDLFIT